MDTEWHRWWAWHPVKISTEVDEGNGYSWSDAGWVCWRWVERRLEPERAQYEGHSWLYRMPR